MNQLEWLGLIWIFVAVGIWLLCWAAVTGDRGPAPSSPTTRTQCAWCGGWLLTSAALLGDIEGALISHGICDGCAEKMEEEGQEWAQRTGSDLH